MLRRDACLAILGSVLPVSVQAAGAAVVPTVPKADGDAMLALAARLRALDQDGLTPAHYAIPADARAATDPQGHANALYAAAWAAMADLLQGRVRFLPNRPDLRRDSVALPAWQARLLGSPDPALVVEQAAALPPGMDVLKLALRDARARVEAGGWPKVPAAATPDATTIEPGSTDPVRVPALRARVAAEDAVLAAGMPADPAVFDDSLLEAVKRWQALYGLDPDGRVGPATLATMNRPAEARVAQLRVAMDQRRAMPRPQPGRRIEVNVPDFRLKLLDGERALLDMAVIVGKPARATPMLAVTMTTVQFNPPWGVPERNAREDLLPKFRRDPRAMIEKGFRVFQYVGGERIEIDPLTVNWASVNAERVPYLFRQDAGDFSALGRLKFIMPNGDDIYLHDTPERGLFARRGRAFSSGCIRLERPMDLLALVLEGTPGWDRAKADAALESRQTSAVGLRRPLPVRLVYQTVVVEQGGLRLRPDIYGLDAAYARALDQRVPPSAPPAPPAAPAVAAGAAAPIAVVNR